MCKAICYCQTSTKARAAVHLVLNEYVALGVSASVGKTLGGVDANSLI